MAAGLGAHVGRVAVRLDVPPGAVSRRRRHPAKADRRAGVRHVHEGRPVCGADERVLLSCVRIGPAPHVVEAGADRTALEGRRAELLRCQPREEADAVAGERGARAVGDGAAGARRLGERSGGQDGRERGESEQSGHRREMGGADSLAPHSAQEPQSSIPSRRSRGDYRTSANRRVTALSAVSARTVPTPAGRPAPTATVCTLPVPSKTTTNSRPSRS